MIGLLFLIQSALTVSLTSMNAYWSFSAVISLMGIVQGGAGGLFMTAVVDAVGVTHARYAYSIENMCDVFVAGFATQMYGNIGDKFFRTEPLETTIEFIKNGTFEVIDIEEERVELDYVYQIAGVCIFLAALMSYRGFALEKKNTGNGKYEVDDSILD